MDLILKKNTYFLIPIILLFPSFIFAQEPLPIPSDILMETNDSIKMIQLFELGKGKSITDKTQQLFIYNKALSIAKKNNYFHTQFLISTNLSLTHIYKGQYDSAIHILSNNLDLLAQEKLPIDLEIIAKNYNNLGHSHYTLKDYPKALEAHLKALSIREAKNSPKLSSSYNNIGLIYMDLQQHQKAIDYFEKSLVLKRKNKDAKGIANSINNLGIIYKNMQHHQKAREYYHEALRISKEIGDIDKIANALANLAQVAFWEDKYHLAINYHKEVLGLRKKQANNYFITETMLRLAQIHLKIHELPEAFNYLKQVTSIINEAHLDVSLSEVYHLHYRYYALVGDSDLASSYYLKKKKITDSLALKKNAMVLADIETKYETEKKEQQIKLLKQKNIIATLELERIQTQRKWIFSILFLLFIIIIVLAWLYRYRSRTNRELEVLNSTKDKLFTIIGHDLKNPLIGFRSITQSLSSNLDTMDKSSILYFIQKLEKSSNQLYLLIQNLLQWAINQSGQLSNNPQRFALEQLVTDVFNLFKINAERENIQLINEVPTNSFVHADLKITQTILRNLIDNAIKFTPKGGTVCVQVAKSGNRLEVSVRDTGLGMSEEEQQNLFQQVAPSINNDVPQKGTGIGLLLCKELAERLSSSIKVNSTIGQGTVFSFSLQQPKNA